ncbi:MAG: hypothetical protein GY950_01825 [bacterium]|nr:hypothetical protein [bacterium]
MNVTVGVDAYSLPTQGLQLQDIAAMIFNHYNGLGYEVTLTGDPAAGFEISTGYFCTSVEALDDTLEIGLGMKIDAIDGPQE